jgi:hypothetical protein
MSPAAEEAADGGQSAAVRTFKEDAQRRSARPSRGAVGPEAVEAAARNWLQEINRINRKPRRRADGRA